MAEREEEQKAGSLLRKVMLLLLVVGGIGAAYATLGWFTLNPGEAAVILRLGKYSRTEASEGFHLKYFPAPIETHEVVNVGISQRLEFGDVDAAEGELVAETAMQTGDNNIVLVEFVVQYKIGRPFESRYRITDLDEILRDAAQAAMREVVGRSTVDGVIAEQKGAIGIEVAELLQHILDDYDSGVLIEIVELQDVQPPEAVRGSFDDVVAANQDRTRRTSEAEGYANEVLPKARAEAKELVEEAIGYREAKVADAEGEADRFLSIVAEYQKAPEITRKRMYLETMEAVLPKVEKVIIEPGTASVLPYLPIGEASRRSEQ